MPTSIHPDSPFYSAGVNKYELDLDKANALLDEAGFLNNSGSPSPDHRRLSAKPHVERKASKKVVSM